MNTRPHHWTDWPTVAIRISLFTAASVLAACGPIERLIDRQANRVIESSTAPDGASPPTEEDAEFRAFYDSLFIADLHADTLLWNRNLRADNKRGHVDLPRLCKGGVDLQVFTVVTQWGWPLGAGACHARSDANMVGLLSFLHTPDWPAKAIVDLERRATVQAEALDQAADPSLHGASEPRLMIIRDRSELDAFLEARGQSERCVVGALLGLEGLHFIDEQPSDGIGRLARQGFSMASLTHHFDNGLAGASTGCTKNLGLEPSGLEVLAAMKDVGMVVDLAHASRKTIKDYIEWRDAAGDSRPFVISHTGIDYGDCKDARNLNADDIKLVARAGGVIGVMYWDKQVCKLGKPREEVIDGIVKAFNALHDALGAAGVEPADHMALGSDFDGGIASPFDAVSLEQLFVRLRRETMPDSTERRYSDADLRKIAGTNVCRVLAGALAPGSAAPSPNTCDTLVQ